MFRIALALSFVLFAILPCLGQEVKELEYKKGELVTLSLDKPVLWYALKPFDLKFTQYNSVDPSKLSFPILSEDVLQPKYNCFFTLNQEVVIDALTNGKRIPVSTRYIIKIKDGDGDDDDDDDDDGDDDDDDDDDNLTGLAAEVRKWCKNIKDYRRGDAIAISANYLSVALKADEFETLRDFSLATRDLNLEVLGEDGANNWREPFFVPLANWQSEQYNKSERKKEDIIKIWKDTSKGISEGKL